MFFFLFHVRSNVPIGFFRKIPLSVVKRVDLAGAENEMNRQDGNLLAFGRSKYGVKPKSSNRKKETFLDLVNTFSALLL